MIRRLTLIGLMTLALFSFVRTGEQPVARAAGTATFTVHKDFEDNNTTPIDMLVACNNGATPDASVKQASDNPDVPAVFTITIPNSSTQCSAVENTSVGPMGYTEMGSQCSLVV